MLVIDSLGPDEIASIIKIKAMVCSKRKQLLIKDQE